MPQTFRLIETHLETLFEGGSKVSGTGGTSIESLVGLPAETADEEGGEAAGDDVVAAHGRQGVDVAAAQGAEHEKGLVVKKGFEADRPLAKNGAGAFIEPDAITGALQQHGQPFRLQCRAERP